MKSRNAWWQIPLSAAALVLLLEISARVAPLLPFTLPVPLFALFILLVSFMLLGRVPAGIRAISKVLLSHLSIFFVPAVIGVGLYMQQLLPWLSTLGIALVISTAVSLVVTAWLAQKLEKEHPSAD